MLTSIVHLVIYIPPKPHMCGYIYKRHSYQDLIMLLPLALGGAELGSSDAPGLSAHCPPCLSSALGMLQEKGLAAPSSPWEELGDCGAAFTPSLEAGRKQQCKEVIINLRRHKVQEKEVSTSLFLLLFLS